MSYKPEDGNEEADEASDDEESETDETKPERDPRIKSLNDENKKWRLRAKRAERQLRDKPGEGQAAADRDAFRSDRDELRVENAVLKAALAHGVDPDELHFRLHKQRALTLDEDGDLPEDFPETAEQVARSMTTKAPKAPTSPKLGARKSRGDARDSDKSALAQRFPALMRRPL